MKNIDNDALPTIDKTNNLKDQKKHVSIKSPNTDTMQVVVIDHRTKLYIPRDASAKEARNRYLQRLKDRENLGFVSRRKLTTTL